VTQAAGGQHRLRVAPALPPVPFWSPAAQARAFLGPLKVVGPTVVGSREAIKLVPLHGQGEYDVAPGSYYPIREIRVAHGASTTTTWDQYRVLPETGSNRSLLSLTARHPSARINGSNADYLTAWKRLTLGN
jgi:hypothetical protein